MGSPSDKSHSQHGGGHWPVAAAEALEDLNAAGMELVAAVDNMAAQLQGAWLRPHRLTASAKP